MKTTADEPTAAHTCSHCNAQANTVTISIDVLAVLDRLVSSTGNSRSTVLQQLILSAERRAIDITKTLPNGQASYLACELKFSESQHHIILDDQDPDQMIDK